MSNLDKPKVKSNEKKTPVVDKANKKEAIQKSPKGKQKIGQSIKKMHSTLETKENKEKLTKKQIISSNVALTKSDVPKEELQKRVELVKSQQIKKTDVATLSQKELEERALDQMTNELGDKGKEAVVQKRIKDYDNKEALVGPGGMPLKDREGNIILKTKFEKLLKKDPEIKKMVDKLQPDLSKKLLAVYGEKKISGYADVLAEKGVKTLEEANEVINQEILKRYDESVKNKKDKDGNPISEEERKKIVNQLKQDMKADPNIASQMAGRMAGNQGITEAQAHNVQPEAMDLKGTARERTLNLIKHFEGYTKKSFWDYKQRTRGYGTKATGPGQTISKEKATIELEQKINSQYNLKKYLSPDVVSKLGDNQIAALTSFIFNLGPGKIKGLKPLLNNYVNEKDTNKKKQIATRIGTTMKQFVHAGGTVLAGLVKRRKTEAKLFEEGGKKSETQKTETPKSA